MCWREIVIDEVKEFAVRGLLVVIVEPIQTVSPMSSPVPGLFGVAFSTIFWIAVISVVAIVLERVITRYLSRVAIRARLEPHVTNNLVLTFRILILVGAVLALSQAGGLQAEWLLTISAVGGAALGFASTKTIGNFVAGLFLLAARPFKVGDYVRLGSVEGLVQEITINYTKVLTIGNSTVSISNIQILDRDVTNFCFENGKQRTVYCYTFEIGFDHSVSTQKIARIFEEVFERHLKDLPRKPEYTIIRSSGPERVYMVYLYVGNPEKIFLLRPQISEEVYSRWDSERGKA